VLVVFTALIFCASTTFELFVKYRNTVVMMKYEDVSDGLEGYPFPAITFNNELKFLMEFNDIVMWLYGVDTPPIAYIIEKLGSDGFVDQ
jgi:hypothetical protein